MTDPYTLVSTDSASMQDHPVWMQAGGSDPSISYSALDLRYLLDAACPTEGVCDPSSMVVAAHAPSNLTIDISAGSVVIGTTANNGKYLARGFGTINLAVPAASGATYLHRVVAELLDKQALSSSAYCWQYRVIQGTTANVLPAEPANAVTLAQVRVASGQTGLTAADITDLRTPCGHSMGVGVTGASSGNIPQVGFTQVIFNAVQEDPWHMWNSATPGQINFRPGMSGLWDFMFTGSMTGSSAYSNNRITTFVSFNGTPVTDTNLGATVNGSYSDLIARVDSNPGTMTFNYTSAPAVAVIGHKIVVPSTGAFIKVHIECPNDGSMELTGTRFRAYRREWRNW